MRFVELPLAGEHKAIRLNPLHVVFYVARDDNNTCEITFVTGDKAVVAIRPHVLEAEIARALRRSLL